VLMLASLVEESFESQAPSTATSRIHLMEGRYRSRARAGP
jgi:hypothetical protein